MNVLKDAFRSFVNAWKRANNNSESEAEVPATNFRKFANFPPIAYVVIGYHMPLIGMGDPNAESREWIAGVFWTEKSAKKFLNEAINDAISLVEVWRNMSVKASPIYAGVIEDQMDRLGYSPGEVVPDTTTPRRGRIDPGLSQTLDIPIYEIREYEVKREYHE